MNREIVLEATLGITVGLIVAAIAAFRSKPVPGAGTFRRAAMLGILTYAVIAAPTFTPPGMSVLGMIALLVVVGLALAGSLLAPQLVAPQPVAQRGVQGLVGTGVAAILLIAAGQTLALLSRLDPRVIVVVVAVTAALLVAGQGLVASSRISSVAMWLLIVPILIALALGFLLGNVSVLASPSRIGDGTPWVAILAVALLIFALGWVDNSLLAGRRAGKWSPLRVLVWVVVVLVLVLVGLLMFFGGVMFAPSMEFFVVPANIDALPGLAGVLLAIVTVLFAALVANALTGVGGLGLDTQPQSSPAEASSSGAVADSTVAAEPNVTVRPIWVWGSAAVAVIVALIDPGSQAILIAVGLLAAALVGAQVGGGDAARGAITGLVATLVGVVVLVVIGRLELGWASIIVTFAVALVGFLVGRFGPNQARSATT
ncbi:MAG: hypothetical protein WBB44_06215 [Candidatus Nanopelagicales bacterium]|nr:hypothetical protein [Candidatus Nanopelagicales bacterium]